LTPDGVTDILRVLIFFGNRAVIGPCPMESVTYVLLVSPLTQPLIIPLLGL
jgi:hypothetical protein